MLGGRTLLYKSCGARFAHEARVTCAEMIFTSAWQVQQLKARVAELEPYKVKYENIQATVQRQRQQQKQQQQQQSAGGAGGT